MEDLERTVNKAVQAAATPRLRQVPRRRAAVHACANTRQLMALDYPYPANLDEAAAVNAEGATAQEGKGKGYSGMYK